MTSRLIGGCCFLVLLTSLEAQSPVRAPADKNPFDTVAHVELGGRLFQTHCSYCHGVSGEGDRGADLTVGQYRQGGSDRELFETIRNGIEGSEMGSVRATDDEVWLLVAFVKRLGTQGVPEKASGDKAAGKIVYETKGACPACHVVDNRGRNLGPELTEIGRRRGLKSLEQSLLKPEADLPMQYRSVQVRTKSGETVVGIRLNEDDFSIQLRDTADNLRSFLKENTQEIRRDNPSLMPAYGSVLTQKELTDLLAYLSSLRGNP
jgi:putative heme-binding domain-containing protein